jgi:hypothetical protein
MGKKKKKKYEKIVTAKKGAPENKAQLLGSETKISKKVTLKAFPKSQQLGKK